MKNSIVISPEINITFNSEAVEEMRNPNVHNSKLLVGGFNTVYFPPGTYRVIAGKVFRVAEGSATDSSASSEKDKGKASQDGG